MQWIKKHHVKWGVVSRSILVEVHGELVITEWCIGKSALSTCLYTLEVLEMQLENVHVASECFDVFQEVTPLAYG